MPLGEKHLSSVLWVFILYFQCLVYGKLTSEEVIHRHNNGRVTENSQKKFTFSKPRNNDANSAEKSGIKASENGVRKDRRNYLVPYGRVQEMPLPLHIEHVKDYPVPVPVMHKTTENVLQVHIHDKNPCKNGGFVAQDFRRGLYCDCPAPYGGTFCEKQQFCFSGPCKNGGKCFEKHSGYMCKCPEGFTGNNCEDKLFCHPNPCEHEGKCVETIQGYRCVCQNGFRGPHCKEIDSCYPNPCYHGGTCENANGVARCQCHPGYHGSYCHEKYVCYVNPCHNGGRCVEKPSQPCLCLRGYVGTFCQDRVCHPNPCLNGGSCSIVDHPLRSHNNRWTFHCACSEYYRGRICQIPHPCIDQPCLNGGTCVDTYYTTHEGREQHYTHDVAVPSMNLQFACNCPPGFNGPRCEIDLCSLCHPDADCINHHCVCKTHFIGDGKYCRNLTSPCHPNPCQHGTCTEGPEGSYDCECSPGYCGPQCKDICDPCLLWPCAHGGQCIPKGENRICLCEPPYEPPECNVTEPDRCNPNPCKNGGKCKFLPEKNDYICDCVGNFGGKDCSECNCPKARRLPDDPSRVVNAICDAIGECRCPSSENGREFTFTDRGCVLGAANPCANNPCKHGKCVVDVSQPFGTGFKCIDCPPPYYGELCECTTCTCENPCKNGATCQDIGTKQYSCVCPPGFTGTDCSVPITKPKRFCYYNKCKHGGTCVERLNGYDCICTPQYTGPHCGVDKCAQCDVNADCIYGRCRCRRGYIGTGYVCEEIRKGSTCGICPVHHYCVQGSCVCMPGYVCPEPMCGECPAHHYCLEGMCVCAPGYTC